MTAPRNGLRALAATLLLGATACTAASPAVSTPAPTVKAVATQVAPTVQAVATQVAPTVVPAAGTVIAASPIKIADVKLTPSDPTLTLTNTGPTKFDLSGFVLRVGNQNVKLPGNFELPPGQNLVLHAGNGVSQGNDVYLGAEAAQLLPALKPGATVELVSPQGATVTRFQLPAA